MSRYLALLRGINVGGRNQIRMVDLRAAFETHGFDEIETYIQSGNIIFGSDDTAGIAHLEAEVEGLITRYFGIAIAVVVIDGRQLRAIVDAAPDGFGGEPERFRYDVIFLKPPLLAEDALPQVPVRDGVDTGAAGPGALYFSRLTARASQSRISRISQLPIYGSMTIRNWNTTTRLLEMVER